MATSALGMGFDKPDLGFVVHLGAPSSPVAYYQQVGRAGRATERAEVLLLPGPEDKDIWAYFASVSMPREEQAEAVLRTLAESGRALSTAALETAVDVRRTRLELLLKVLDVDGAVQRVSGGWVSTGVPWAYDAERYARVAAARQAEQQLMVDYERTDACRMAFLQECLDDDTAVPCGRCDGCAGPWYSTEVADRVVGAARERLARAGVDLDPRVQWPTGMDRLGVPVKGKIPPDEALLPGRALARLSDLGWGQRLREVLRDDAPAHPDLLRACVPVLAEWGWARRPVGIVAVPSRSRPTLVGSLAAGLSEMGRLPLLGSLDLAHGGPTGEAGGNSAFRLAGVWERLVVGPELAAALAGVDGPVLLVDDLVSSRWTLTVAGRALRLAGADGRAALRARRRRLSRPRPGDPSATPRRRPCGRATMVVEAAMSGRAVTWSVAVALVVGLAACGSTPARTGGTGPPTPSPSVTASAGSATGTPAPPSPVPSPSRSPATQPTGGGPASTASPPPVPQATTDTDTDTAQDAARPPHAEPHLVAVGGAPRPQRVRRHREVPGPGPRGGARDGEDRRADLRRRRQQHRCRVDPVDPGHHEDRRDVLPHR